MKKKLMITFVVIIMTFSSISSIVYAQTFNAGGKMTEKRDTSMGFSTPIKGAWRAAIRGIRVGFVAKFRYLDHSLLYKNEKLVLIDVTSYTIDPNGEYVHIFGTVRSITTTWDNVRSTHVIDEVLIAINADTMSVSYPWISYDGTTKRYNLT